MEARTREIVETAFELFQNKGYDKVSVVDICQACDITKPTFYRYMNSKENILLCLFKSREEFIMPDVQALAEQGQILPALYKGLTFNHSVAMEIGWDLMGKYINYLLANNIPSLRYESPFKNAMIDILQKAQDQNLIQKEDSAEDLYMMLAHLDQGLLLYWTASRGEISLEKQYHASLVNLLRVDDSTMFLPHGILN